MSIRTKHSKKQEIQPYRAGNSLLRTSVSGETRVPLTRSPNIRTLVEATYTALRRDIVHGRLEPGMKLRAEILKERYAVSSSTLREALARLIGDGLVISEGQRGFRVQSMSIEDLADLTATRKLVEVEALRQAIMLGDETWEAGVVAAFHRLSRVEERLGLEPPEKLSEQWEERNREFHEALLAGCPSRWLHFMYRVLYQQAERYRIVSLKTASMSRDVHAEHQEIKEAALSRDIERACAALGEHIERTLQMFRKHLKKTPSPR
jgi:GntR family carbon starvation induced transcriptional regulator